MPEWSTACPDWEQRIVERRSLIPFAPIFAEEGRAALVVFKKLKMVDAPGSPTFGEVCDQFVFDFVEAIFGAYDAETGKRLIREFLLLISKKNGKSTIAAGIMITALIRNWRKASELMILAPTIEVANNSYGPAAEMVREDEELSALMDVQDHKRTITHKVTRAVLKVVAADSDTVSGKKAGFILVDELWLFGKKPRADAMLREATGGLISRPEGFVVYLTTHSDEPPAGVYKAKLHYFRKVRDGKITDPRSLGVLYEWPQHYLKSGEYENPENFYITNPNIGRSVAREWLEEELTKAKDGERGALQVFLAKHLNVEIGIGLRTDAWSGAEYWKRGEDAAITLDALIERSEVIVVGADGGGLDDLFGLNVLGREEQVRDWLSWSHAYAHQSVFDRRKSIASRLHDFAAAGELTIVDDDLQDIASIVEIIDRINQAGKLGAVAVDMEGPYGELIDALALIGVTVESGQLVGVGQGYRLMNAIKTTERKLANGTFRHAPSTMMDWCVGNLKIEPTATAIRATKQNAGDAKIDPIMALFDAVSVMTTNPEAAAGPSFWEMVG